jgi:hypothetical protein
MTREIRSRRAGIPREQAKQSPLYARILGLQYLAPSGLLCFAFLEGAIALGILLALAELVSWWGVLVLPLTVAAMVKLNDVIAGAVSRPAMPPVRSTRTTVRQRTAAVPATPVLSPPVAPAEPVRRRPPVRPAAMETQILPAVVMPHPNDVTVLNNPAVVRPWASRAEELDATQQRARQTASRRYE